MSTTVWIITDVWQLIQKNEKYIINFINAYYFIIVLKNNWTVLNMIFIPTFLK